MLFISAHDKKHNTVKQYLHFFLIQLFGELNEWLNVNSVSENQILFDLIQ